MKLIKRFFRFIDKKIIVPITKFFVSIGEKLKLSDKPLEKALSKIMMKNMLLKDFLKQLI